MSWEELVARQAGVVSLAQAVAHGYSAARAHRRVREGGWRRLHPGVFLVGGHRLTDEARVRAAWLWAADPDAAGPRAAGPKVAVTGPAAAHWHGMLARGPAVVDVTVPRGAKPRAQPGLRVHRRDLALRTWSRCGGSRSRAGGSRRWRPRSRSRTVRRSSTAPSNGM